MICPVCENPMVVLELHQIEIDHCLHCGGIWLDAGELELLLDTDEDRARLREILIEDDSVKEKKYGCPICNKKMSKVFVGEEKKILIDKCERNHGLWLDKGELEEVIELSTKNKEGKIIHLLKQMFESSAGGRLASGSKLSSKNNGGSK
jgi:Zn-finger nucleic acid-binding protein